MDNYNQNGGSSWQSNYESTIYQKFVEAYGENSDKLKAVNWKDDHSTFRDGSKHTIQFLYMERGAGASNLKLEVNIPTIPDGGINIYKEVTGLNSNQIKNETYTFQITDNGDNPISNMPYTLSDGKTGSTNELGELNIPAGKTATITGITAVQR